MKKIKVASIQLDSINNSINSNLEKADDLTKKAAKQNAKLIILPEFMSTGYIFSEEIWNSAESINGQTVNWLKKTSKKLNIWLGTTFLEAINDHFYNTFILTDPSGQIVGTVRKQTPAGFESYYMKGEQSNHIIETEIGKISVGICYENQLAYMPKLIHENSADIHIMPHSAPTPMSNLFFSKKNVAIFVNFYKNLPTFYSQNLGIPVILSNKCGVFKSPIPGVPFMHQETDFMGHSAISDSDGKLKSQMKYEEGFIVSEINLDPSRKIQNEPKTYGHWSWEIPLTFNFLRMTEFQGKMNYKFNRKRKEKALRISQNIMN